MSNFSEEAIYQAIARGWCDERNSDKEFDAALADAIAIEVLAVLRPLRAENERLNRVNDAWYIEVERLKARNVKLEKVVEAYNTEWRSPGPTCTCDEAYTGCLYHQSPLVWDALAEVGEG